MPRGTGQPRKEQDNKDRDVNTRDEEDVCNTMMKSMKSRCSNTTHEEEHDAKHDEEEDEDTTHAILIVDENEGKIENDTQRERERAERNHRRRRRRSRQEEDEQV